MPLCSLELKCQVPAQLPSGRDMTVDCGDWIMLVSSQTNIIPKKSVTQRNVSPLYSKGLNVIHRQKVYVNSQDTLFNTTPTKYSRTLSSYILRRAV